MKKGTLLIILLFTTSINLCAQNEHLYEDTYDVINQMLVDSTKYSFKKAVFSVENTYHHGTLDSIFFYEEIKKLSSITNKLTSSRKLSNYNYSDKLVVTKYASLYSVMRDTIPIVINNEEFEYIPFRYDFEDIWGEKEWSNIFVSKLLYSNTGNCHSLPYLYKILAEEIGVDAHLALAPNHIYIKHRNEKDGWYNTELTSGFFPIDAWIMASGYVHLDGIRNGLYMKALDNKESLSLVLIDLAQGYEKQHPINDGSFIFKCVDKALEYNPNLINALLLKLETTKKNLEYLAEKKNKEIDEIFDDPKAKEIWINLNNQVRYIHELGYRQMPKDMYLDWLVSLKEEKEKYSNTKVSTFKKPK